MSGRSAAASFSALGVFLLVGGATKAVFPETLAAGGAGRDVLSVIVLGSTLGTFSAVYLTYSRWRGRRRR